MSLQARLEHILEQHFPDTTAPGGALMLWQKNGDTIFAARGIADLDTGAPITPDTTFRLASVSKQFTAASIIQLLERGALSLDRALTDIFPSFPAYGSAITVEHLLRHTSGIKDYEKLIPPDQAIPVTDAMVLELLGQQSSGDFQPGEQFRYSNSGYAILAMIVEKISGLSFPDYLQENLFRPAGMNSSVAFVDKPGLPQPPNRAIGYALQPDASYKWADQNVTTAVLGDGGVYCSVADYAHWISAYLQGRIIGDSWVTLALKPGKTNDGQSIPYGYGWRLDPGVEGNGKGWQPYHPGSTSGFRNGVVLDADGNWAALCLTNRCNGDAVAIARSASLVTYV